MADPLKGITQFQRACLEAYMAQAQQMWQVWQHVIDLQQQMMQQACKHHRDHVEIATGPSFMDRYGKRAHDIDPERAV